MLNAGTLVVMYHNGEVKTDKVEIEISDGRIVKFPGFWEINAGYPIDTISSALFLVSRYGKAISIEINIHTEELLTEESSLKRDIKGPLSYSNNGELECMECHLDVYTGKIETHRGLTSVEIEDITFALLLGSTTVMVGCYMDDEGKIRIDMKEDNVSWLWFYALGMVEYKKRYRVEVEDHSQSRDTISIYSTQNGRILASMTEDQLSEAGWNIVDREDMVADLKGWICESQDRPDIGLMQQDLAMLEEWSDTEVWSSNRTNEFVSMQRDPLKSDDIVSELLLGK